MAKAKCVHHVHNYTVSKGYKVPCWVQSGMERKCVTLLTSVLTPQTTILSLITLWNRSTIFVINDTIIRWCTAKLKVITTGGYSATDIICSFDVLMRLALLKGLFTPCESLSEGEKYQKTNRKDQRINGKHQSFFSFAFAFARSKHSLKVHLHWEKGNVKATSLPGVFSGNPIQFTVHVELRQRKHFAIKFAFSQCKCTLEFRSH